MNFRLNQDTYDPDEKMFFYQELTAQSRKMRKIVIVVCYVVSIVIFFCGTMINTFVNLQRWVSLPTLLTLLGFVFMMRPLFRRLSYGMYVNYSKYKKGTIRLQASIVWTIGFGFVTVCAECGYMIICRKISQQDILACILVLLATVINGSILYFEKTPPYQKVPEEEISNE